MSTIARPGCIISRAGIIIRAGVGLSTRMGMQVLGKGLLELMALRIAAIIRLAESTHQADYGSQS